MCDLFGACHNASWSVRSVTIQLKLNETKCEMEIETASKETINSIFHIQRSNRMQKKQKINYYFIHGFHRQSNECRHICKWFLHHTFRIMFFFFLRTETWDPSRLQDTKIDWLKIRPPQLTLSRILPIHFGGNHTHTHTDDEQYEEGNLKFRMMPENYIKIKEEMKFHSISLQRFSLFSRNFLATSDKEMFVVFFVVVVCFLWCVSA